MRSEWLKPSSDKRWQSPRTDWRRPCANRSCAMTLTLRSSTDAGRPGFCSDSCFATHQ